MSAEGEKGWRRLATLVSEVFRRHAISDRAARGDSAVVRAARVLVRVVHFRAVPQYVRAGGAGESSAHEPGPRDSEDGPSGNVARAACISEVESLYAFNLYVEGVLVKGRCKCLEVCFRGMVKGYTLLCTEH